MVEGLIGKKIGMSQSFDAQGNAYAVTVIQAGPCTVIQKKTKDKDGYASLQLGLVDPRPVRKPNKPQTGHFLKSGGPVLRVLREFSCTEPTELKEGDQVLVDIFAVGDAVDVTGTSKGKGFAGVVRRHGFAGGKDTHGSMFHRRPGSIGASSFPSRVTKGKRMAGQMGHDRITAKRLIVVELDKDNNLLVVKGAIPGPSGGYVLIRKGNFSKASK
ncbi:MAG: 50S ribosomal protein L3 [Candidatus Aminicenantes bacterium]|nr:50S ribosomal protein L3 [Candidatus Aminicenantes bacterium]